MHQIEYEYDPKDMPRIKDIEVVKIDSLNAKTQKEVSDHLVGKGEVIVQVKCSDGLFMLKRKNYRTKKPSEK